MSASGKDFYLYIDGKPVKVSKEVYQEYYRSERKERYFMEDLKNGKISIDQESQTVKFILGKEDSYERLLDMDRQFAVSEEKLEDKVVRGILLEKALKNLTPEEMELIWELFYLEKTERQVSEALHITKTTLHRQRDYVLNKLKKLLEEDF